MSLDELNDFWTQNEITIACKNNDISYIKNTNYKIEDLHNDFGVTPLTIAAGFGHLDLVKYLVEVKKENIDGLEYKIFNNSYSNPDSVPLIAAICGNHVDVVKYLIYNKASIDIDLGRKYEYGFTPIFYTYKHKNREIIELLLNNGVKLDDDVFENIMVKTHLKDMGMDDIVEKYE